MARTGRPSVAVVLDSEEREVLERYVRRRKTAARLALRARIVLRCADGWTNQEIASKLNVTPGTASKWRGRFARSGLMACWKSHASENRAASATTRSSR